MRVWTVGRETPLENRSLQVSGVRSMVLVPDSAAATPVASQEQHEEAASEAALNAAPLLGSALCLFANGGIGIHDLRRNKWEFQKDAVSFFPNIET